MDVTGSIGSDWLHKHSGPSKSDDSLLRAWRDFLEQRLKDSLGLDSDFTLGEKTRFILPTNSRHTVTEIESFGHRALDNFLNNHHA